MEVDLSKTGVGLWWQENDGSRTFVQPRNTVLVAILGNETEDIYAYLKVKAPKE